MKYGFAIFLVIIVLTGCTQRQMGIWGNSLQNALAENPNALGCIASKGYACGNKTGQTNTSQNDRDTPTCRAARAARGVSCRDTGTGRVNCTPDPIPAQCE